MILCTFAALEDRQQADMTDTMQWYAFRILRGRRNRFLSKLKGDGVRIYSIEKVTAEVEDGYVVKEVRTPLFPNIVFVRAAASYVVSIQRNPDSCAAPYTEPGTRIPAVIPDREMEILMFVNEASGYKIDAYDGDITKGDHVKVLGGVFEGAEGYVVRIKGNRRFVVSINGVVAVATTYIPKEFLRKIEA